MTKKLLLILRFYLATMLFACGAVNLTLAWVVKVHGATTIPALMVGKAAIYALYLYVWIVPRYAGEFYYYRNLGIRRRALLGVSGAVDFLLCYAILKCTAAFLYDPV